MINDSNKTEIIDLYLSGDLDADLLKEFEAKLNQEEAFRNEVSIQRAITKNIRKAGREDLRKMLKFIHLEMGQDTEEGEHDALSVPKNEIQEDVEREEKLHSLGRSSPKTYFYYVAASLVFFLLVGIGVFYSSVNPESLTSQQLALYEIPSTRNEETSQEPEIVRSYQREKYQSVLGIFEGIAQPTLQDLFLAGNAFLALSEYEKAQEAFITVISKNQELPLADQRFNEDAEYFLGLVYLKNNEIEKAEEIFTKIQSQADHQYNEKVNRWFLFKIKILQIKSN